MTNGGDGGLSNKTHKSDCICCMCKAQRREVHKEGCKCASCLSKRGEYIHKEGCTCASCKAKRHESRGPCLEETKQRIREANTGHVTYEEAKKKQSKAHSGRIWIHNLDLKIAKAVRPEDVQKYLDSGYQSGRLPHKLECNCIGCKTKRGENILIGRVWVYNLSLRESKIVEQDKVQEYLNQGYQLGRLPGRKSKKEKDNG